VNRRLAVFAGLTGLALVAVILVVLATGGPGLAGSTGVPPDVFVAELKPGQSACQVSASLPADASTAQVVVGAAGASRIRLGFSATSGRKVVARGVVVASPGTAKVPIEGSATRARVDRICLRNLGDVKVAVAGRSGGAIALGPRGAIVPATLSVLYVRADAPNWFSQAGAVADRFSHGRLAPLGGATLWLALFIALAGGVAAVVTTVLAQRD